MITFFLRFKAKSVSKVTLYMQQNSRSCDVIQKLFLWPTQLDICRRETIKWGELTQTPKQGTLQAFKPHERGCIVHCVAMTTAGVELCARVCCSESYLTSFVKSFLSLCWSFIFFFSFLFYSSFSCFHLISFPSSVFYQFLLLFYDF